ncbi:MAG: hypothetical protein KJ939_08190 [Nanoarchaeota archaeon]|nr:hypothetical protein [Nanoarchaeota archaeon]
MKKDIPDKWFYFAIITLGLYFIYRLINQSQMIFQFPLESTNDYGAHMAQLFLLVKYGFHAFVPDWYDGFKLFLFYPPGWYFFVLPLYLLVKNMLLTTYLSVLIMFGISFLAIFLFGKTQKFSISKRIIFFLLLFANAISIGNYIRLGRVSEHFALTCFIILGLTFLYYKDKKINWGYFLIFIPSYFFIIISHPSTAIIFHVFFLSFWLFRSFKEKILISLAALLTIILSSFWWYPFLTSFSPDMNRANFAVATRILEFSGPWLLTSLATFFVIAIFLFTFFLYWKSQNYSKKTFNFFSLIILLAILFVTRIIVFVPLLNKVYPDVYMFFFLFFSIYFLLKLDLNKISPLIKRLILISLIVFPILTITISEIHTPKFVKYTQLEKDNLEILSYVDGRFMIPNGYSANSHPPMYAAYGTIYLNLSTTMGVSNFGTTSLEYFDRLRDFRKFMVEKDCNSFLDTMVIMDTTDIIAYNEDCSFLNNCGLTEVKSKGEVCLYKLGEQDL